jgi:serine/threonine-protein kinase
LSEQRAPVPEPTEIAGRYLIVKKLGAGAFGTVYKAKDKILGRMVAIKTIRMEGLAAAGASVDELVDRFKREAQVSAQLRHPNIVTIYDVGESGGMSYLAMEFIDGVGLEKVIASAGRLPVERAAGLAAQVADALDFAHKSNVVHRDIKPANIMVEAGDRVKVTDFGIAKVTDSADHLTVTGSLLGTPSYMSPEQARGAPLDGRSDLFAVGAVLYEMIAGKKAFRGDSITGLIFKIITEEPPPIRELDPSVPDEVVRILAKALAKAPDGRYQTGREMADDLLALTRPASTPTLRQAEIATTPALKTPPAPPTINATPTMQGAVLTSQAAPATVVSPPPPPPPVRRASPPPPPAAQARVPSPPPPAPRSSSTGLLVGVAAGALLLLLAVGGAGWYVLGRRAAPPQASGTLDGTAGAAGTTAAPVPPTTLAAAPPTAAGTTEPAGTSAAPAAAAEPPPAAAERAAPPRATDRGAPPAATPAERSGAATAAAPPPAAAEPPRADARFRYLDEEPQADGREAGNAAADAYRTRQQGWAGSSSSSGYGTNRRFAQRERSPRQLAPVERPAVATLRHLMDREEAYKKANGRYGTFGEMARAAALALDVPIGATSISRKGYQFAVTVEEDSFRITAIPASPGARSFVGDDSGIIRPGVE